ncbi:MAG: hypothetical protein NT132_02955 [Microbacterium sp.]|uniref:TA system antitoxin ParD family protein n=1 Tax=Microbacterium sp. TaxID=51671 RepID=UPI00260D9E7C|nr:hypothetical protein [Microbacterium sp.]MCX6501357.1 hypothetical protein [Microbacterium sp.]
MSIPARIDDQLFEAARAVGAVAHRSAVQQLQHWARVGMELEASPNVSVAHVERILAGSAAYDDAPETVQAAARVAWMELIDGDTEQLDLRAEAARAGDVWIGADAEGTVVRRDAASMS